MSKYGQTITQVREEKYLLEALREMGYRVEVHPEGTLEIRSLNTSFKTVKGLRGNSLDLALSQNFWQSEVPPEEFPLHKGG